MKRRGFIRGIFTAGLAATVAPKLILCENPVNPHLHYAVWDWVQNKNQIKLLHVKGYFWKVVQEGEITKKTRTDYEVCYLIEKDKNYNKNLRECTKRANLAFERVLKENPNLEPLAPEDYMKNGLPKALNKIDFNLT